jgi:uracil phosphoribosyltransferase
MEVEIIKSNFINHHLSYLRQKDLSSQLFQQHANLIFNHLGGRLYDFLPIITQQIETPLAQMEAEFTDTKGTLLVAVLRSAYPMCQGIQKSLGESTLAVVDIKRDEETAEPHLNYDGIPKDLSQYNRIIIPDPMLASGGSACMVIDLLKQRGAKNIIYLSLISAEKGISRINQNHPDVKVVVCALDPSLNDKSYIVPGLGDFGDRYFSDQALQIPDTINNVTLSYEPNGHFTLQPNS